VKAFCLTYGDGVSDVNITDLVDFHGAQKVKATLTATIPPGCFGALDMGGNKVNSFREKPKGDLGFSKLASQVKSCNETIQL